MSILDTVKSLFGGSVEGKIGEVLQGLANQIKPLIAKGEVGELVSNAVSNFGDLGDQLKGILSKISGATADTKTKLISDKNSIVKSLVEKGGEMVKAVSSSSELPQGLKDIAKQAEALLAKLK